MTSLGYYLPDTNAWTGLLKQRNSQLRARFESTPQVQLRFCSVVKAELLFGAAKSNWGARMLADLEALFAPFESVPFDDRAARAYGNLRAYLTAAGTPIGANDLLIASIALANNLILVTHNTREFTRVPGLRVEDWEA